MARRETHLLRRGSDAQQGRAVDQLHLDFCEQVIEWWIANGEPPIPTVLSALEKASDILPDDYCQILGLPLGSTFGRAAEAFRSDSERADLNLRRATTKHGVHITEHRNWNTKRIYNNGHFLHIYRRQPKNIQFRSSMVNDFNQHLCGGWHIPEIGNENKGIAHRLLNRQKPLGVICCWKEEEALACVKRLKASDLIVTSSQREVVPTKMVYDVLACQRGRLNDLFDLDSLLKDYRGFIISDLNFEEEFAQYGSYQLCDFFSAWDYPERTLVGDGIDSWLSH